MTTPRLGLDELIQNQSQPHVPINTTIRLIDALLHLAVIDKDLTAPPGAESDGDTYIVGSAATGVWSGHDADIAYFQDTGYVFVDPRIGMWAYVEDEDARYQYTGNTGNGWELIDVGVGGGSSTSGARVTTSGNQAISSSTITAVNWGTELFDTDSYWDAGSPTRFTIPSNGIYQISASIFSAGGSCDVSLRLDGSGDRIGFQRSGGGALSMALQLTAGQYVEVVVFGTSGFTITDTEQLNSFSIKK